MVEGACLGSVVWGGQAIRPGAWLAPEGILLVSGLLAGGLLAGRGSASGWESLNPRHPDGV